MPTFRSLFLLLVLGSVPAFAGRAMADEDTWSPTAFPADQAPIFDDYPAPPPGWPRPEPVAMVDLESDPRAWQFAGLLESAVGKGRNFAANYRLVEIGCGTGCATIATVHADTGAVVIGPMAAAGVDRSAVSALLVVNPLDRLRQSYGFRIPLSIYPQYYLFTEAGFERIWCWHPGVAPAADYSCNDEPLPSASVQVLMDDAGEGAEFFGDWTAYCDAEADCTAETYQREWAASDNLLLLARDSGQPEWAITLLTSAPLAALPQDMGAAVDDGPETAFGPGELSMNDISGDGRLYTSEIRLLGGKARAMLKQLLPGASLSIAFSDADGQMHMPRFSLFSITAALRWVDKQQSLRTAGVSTETPPVSPEPPGKIPPEVFELHAMRDDCEPLAGLQHGEHQIAATDLGDGAALYALPCAGGGFNLAYVAYLDAGGEIGAVQFVDYTQEESWFPTPYLFNTEWNRETLTLTSFLKGRSLGDCGSTSEWRYAHGTFRLERLFYQRDCDGAVPPGDLPLFFEAKPAPVCGPGEPCD